MNVLLIEWRGREHALAFDRVRVFDDLFLPSMSATLGAEHIRSA